MKFQGARAYEHALTQCTLGPRPTGSEAARATAAYIIASLQESGWEVETQQFGYRGVTVRNIIASAGQGELIILGAHYDTRPRADRDPHDPSRPVPGGNDGASGVAVLLELAQVLDPQRLSNQVWLAFFDAEDRGGLDGWPFSVGSSYLAENLSRQPVAVIVVDMVGDADQQLYMERSSSPELLQEVWSTAARLGYGDYFIPRYKWSLVDDHTPFLQRGHTALDIIDFDYPYWHTAADTCDKISAESLERVGRVLEAWLLQSKRSRGE
ncbi:MAG: M28 family peptidase [Anaerolineae bacterium]